MLCGLLRKPGFGIKPQLEILGGDGVSVRKDSALVVSSAAATLPDDGMEEEDREVTSASGEVCTLGVSTAKSASMRKFLDFSIGAPGARPCRLCYSVNDGEVSGVFPPLKSYDVVRSVREELRVTLNPCQMEAIGAAVCRGLAQASRLTQQRLSALITVEHAVGCLTAFI